MERGSVYWVNLNPTKGSEIKKIRPCVLVGATPINKARRTVIVVPLSTSATPRPPIVIPVTCNNKKVSAVCDQIRTIDKSRIESQIGQVSDKDMDKIDDGLRLVLALAK